VVALARRPIEVPQGVAVRITDYADRDALRRALEDIHTLVFVSSDGEGTRVLSHHLNVVAAVRECGVGHVVALSSVDADPASPFCSAITNGLTELALRESGCGLSVVRASIYSEFFLGFLRAARDTGRLRLPAGDGRIGLVSKTDVARCMAALAVAEPTGRRSARPTSWRSWPRPRSRGGSTPTRACSPRCASSGGTGLPTRSGS
jgi:NAD(P)H dehydrogenase (quinone)